VRFHSDSETFTVIEIVKYDYNPTELSSFFFNVRLLTVSTKNIRLCTGIFDLDMFIPFNAH
jgi:hypothetical protein